MTTTETASPPSSEARFLDENGVALLAPLEWKRCYLVVEAQLEELPRVAVRANGRELQVTARNVNGVSLVLAEWNRSGPGWYSIDIDIGRDHESFRVRVSPEKISPAALSYLLTDLETQLPVTLAIALRDSGARLGIRTESLGPQTMAMELARLRRAVRGGLRPGLSSVLAALASDPHRMLLDVGIWSRRENVRRPDPNRLVHALSRPGNIEGALPSRVVDRRVEHTVDLYENRVLKAFHDEVDRRLRRLAQVLTETEYEDLHRETVNLLSNLSRARRQALFLDQVGQLQTSPEKPTMVLIKRMEYRAMFEGFLAFRRQLKIHFDEPLMAEPLRNLPYLYQRWGLLHIVSAVVRGATNAGFRTLEQRLVWPHGGGAYVRVLRENAAALVMRGPAGETIRVFHERSYGRQSKSVRSVSFTQEPDVAVELVRPDGRTEIYLFDPKYKLDSEALPEPGTGRPVKMDIDKMHAYRDAIRFSDGSAVVGFAATLYPGASVQYGPGLAALRLYPSEESGLVEWVSASVSRWLRRSIGEV